jgi:hypothetical protein
VSFAWTPANEEAAFLLAEDRLSDQHIAKRTGIDRTTLWRWKADAEFAGRVKQLRDQLRQDVFTRGVADKKNRLAALDDKARKIEAVFADRAARAAAEVEKASGGQEKKAALEARRDEIQAMPLESRRAYTDELTTIEEDLWMLGNRRATPQEEIPPDEALTGLIVRERKAVGSGDTQEIVTQWRVDTATLREYRETLKQAAVEMGEWDEAPQSNEKNGRARMFTARVQVTSHEDRGFAADAAAGSGD